ncbi:hypothetical protein FMM05_02800 [Flavobacterium zepuense]|uniref:PepSY domain-containing protein n=1 Tax=Flavobacterium zepuense TaxID=2593302 RepID=A0A552VAS4_9FLAO|nr:hypothetical protein [Flavobacterium zepuense]TRW27585.1 hypothetical protein FMM05_02800 [Flavobacterium zepuense]
MKKLFIAVVLAAGFTATAAPTAQIGDEIISVFQEKQYKKIEVSQVSKDALDKIKKSYGNYTIKEAHKADDGEYKLVLSKDGTDITATFTPAGDLIKIY